MQGAVRWWVLLRCTACGTERGFCAGLTSGARYVAGRRDRRRQCGQCGAVGLVVAQKEYRAGRARKE